ncbi:class I SAM-dependent methyltransferase [Halalkalibacter hemicellulosilyticus]|uniref:Nicotianamine synthase n=1 Tax=Halalkalibacter hemicellulosilyticusJCM 9152 TaxID=1236971 RepID=W4Q9J5_9BACI|nr:nicotianamine synthase family protein [Halalkalibacter hemicellulosilyticus]GAE28731.1 nicotianamine synthase [Halalkalibacter hemicellulosilyticusJCM 9152]
MNAIGQIQDDLKPFREKFGEFASLYDRTLLNSSELELLLDTYSSFIIDEDNKKRWEQLEQREWSELDPLVDELREQSARCVAVLEKYRALRLLENGEIDIADYFKNIESCIEKEFGHFQVTADSKVLLVGSGAFPMTPLLIAKKTGAEVVGIDIDEEAIDLGRKVISKLGPDLSIRLENTFVENLDCTKELTHIIFSSTVASKYDILEQLYDLTEEHVVVAMRFGNQLKSIFNYPLQKVNTNKWRMVEQILQPTQVFDIALYQKGNQSFDL